MCNEKLQIVLMAALNLAMLGMAPAEGREADAKAQSLHERLEQTRSEMDTALDECVSEVWAFFDDAAARTEDFAEGALSLEGAVAWSVDRLPWTTGDLLDAHMRYQRQIHLFRLQRLHNAFQTTAYCYSARRVAAENRLLVDLGIDVEGFPISRGAPLGPDAAASQLKGIAAEPAAGAALVHGVHEFVVAPTVIEATSIPTAALIARLGIGIPARAGGAVGLVAGLGASVALDEPIHDAIDRGLRLVDLSPRQHLAEATARALARDAEILIEGNADARTAEGRLVSLAGESGNGWAERVRMLALSMAHTQATRPGLREVLKAFEEQRHEQRVRCVLRWYTIQHLYGR